MIFALFTASLCYAPSTYGSTQRGDFQFGNVPKKDTLEIKYDRYAPTLKAKIEQHIRKARIFANLAIAMLPASIITFGLSYIASLAFAIVAAFHVSRLRVLQSDFPEVEQDAALFEAIKRSYLRIILLTLGIFGLPVGIFFLLTAFILFEATITTFVFFSAFWALLSFILLDWLVFRSGKK
jgi:uncharacterized membrane protein YvlD (DUF360 family)